MTKLCQCCSKRYLCKEVDTKEEQKEYKESQEWEIQDDILAQIMILQELLEEK